jgi:GT2 family glycosyltransferase
VAWRQVTFVRRRRLVGTIVVMVADSQENEARSRDSRAAVVILNYRGWQDTLACIDSVVAMADVSFDLVIVDNASGDESVERISEHLRRQGAPVATTHGFETFGPIGAAVQTSLGVTKANDGFSAGNNHGIEYALARGAEFVWVLNNDTEPEPDALRELLAAADVDERIGIVGAHILHADSGATQYFGGASYRFSTGRSRPHAEGDVLAQSDYIAGCAMLLRAEAIREIGGLTEGYFLYGEEIDLCRRMTDVGWRLAIAGNARVHHKEGAASGAASAWRDTSTLATHYSCRSAVLLARQYQPPVAPLTWLLRLAFAVVLVFIAPRNAKAMLRGATEGLRTPLGTLHHPNFNDHHIEPLS